MPTSPAPIRRRAPPVRPPIRTGASSLAAALAILLPGDAPALQSTGESGPLEVDAAYTGDLWANASGGLRRGTTALGNLDLTARVDGATLFGWEGTSLFLYGLANHGGEPTALTGDAQVVSNIEAPEAVRLYEAWIEKNWSASGLSLLAGLYDLNSEFDVLEEADLFLNSSFGIGAELGNSGVNGPSIFPVTSLAVRTRWRPTRTLYLQATLLDGVPGDPSDPGATAVRLSREEGALWAAEVGYVPGGEEEAPEHRRAPGRVGADVDAAWKLSFGVWQYTRASEGVAGGPAERARPGFYLLAEGRPFGGEDGRDVGVFLRLGTADERTNRFDTYLGTGVTWTAPLPGRRSDAIGLGVAIARNGRAFREQRRADGRPVSSTETTVEATYRLRVTPHLALQPDVQLVLDPDTDPTLEPALAVGLRAVLSL